MVSGARVHPDEVDKFGENTSVLYREYSMNLLEEFIPNYTIDEYKLHFYLQYIYLIQYKIYFQVIYPDYFCNISI